MKSIKLMLFPLLFTACATPKMYINYPDWDANRDNRVQRNEFVEGYMNTNYFDKWGDGKTSISYSVFYSNVFKTLDKDSNAKLSSDEFNAQIRVFYFGLFSGSFDQWDNNKDLQLDLNEFTTNVVGSNLSTLWDTNSDKRISKKEVAGGMFYLCDADNNSTVDEAEFTFWKSSR